jgi:hypothetical protein
MNQHFDKAFEKADEAFKEASKGFKQAATEGKATVICSTATFQNRHFQTFQYLIKCAFQVLFTGKTTIRIKKRPLSS